MAEATSVVQHWVLRTIITAFGLLCLCPSVSPFTGFSSSSSQNAAVARVQPVQQCTCSKISSVATFRFLFVGPLHFELVVLLVALMRNKGCCSSPSIMFTSSFMLLSTPWRPPDVHLQFVNRVGCLWLPSRPAPCSLHEPDAFVHSRCTAFHYGISGNVPILA